MKVQFETVMARYKEATKAASYAEVGRELGLSTSAYANRKKADSIPYEQLLPAARSRNISIEWLLFGEGEAFPAAGAKVRPVPEIDSRLMQTIFLQLSQAMADATYDELTDLSQRVGIAGVIYNRVAAMQEGADRYAAIQREVSDFARVATMVRGQPRQRHMIHDSASASGGAVQHFYGSAHGNAGRDIVHPTPGKTRGKK